MLGHDGLRLFIRQESGTVARVDQPPVGSGNDLHASVRFNSGVKRRPQGDERVPVEIGPPVLVPDKFRAFPARLVHEHRPVTGDRRIRSVDSVADLLEDPFAHEGTELGIQFHVLDLPVTQRGPLVTLALRSRPVAASFRVPVQLHHDPAVVDIGPAQHDVVDPPLQAVELTRLHHGTETQVALSFEDRPLGLGNLGVHG